MESNKRTNIDVMLDELKQIVPPGKDSFSTASEFKKDFMAKVKQLKPVNSPLSKLKFYAAATVVAATMLGALFFLDLDSTSSIPAIYAPEWDGTVSARKNGLIGYSDDTFSARKNGFIGFSDSDIPEINDIPILNTEEYKGFIPNTFLSTKEQSLSTFGADVDTASYTNVRRMLMLESRLPPVDAVRIEEFINYFHYDYPAPKSSDKFAVSFEMMKCPWTPEHKLLLIGLQARKIELEKLPPSNFVFLVDTSGSMSNSMPLVIEAMSMLAKQLRPNDKVSLVTYGGGVQILLDGLAGEKKAGIIAKLEALRSCGYTPGGAGIQTAYQLARKHFIRKGNNRIILITDGDFNVGASSESELVRMVETERKSEVYLSVFGVGMGNYKDNKLKMLANKGNGNYGYLDNIREAKNALVNEYKGGMFTLARDVKLQVEFNSDKIHAYRLLGYELRKMENRDFRDDTKDSGEIGVGHQVTALYELVMEDAPENVKRKSLPDKQNLKYQKITNIRSDELLTFRLRYRDVEGNASATEKEFVLKDIPQKTMNVQWASCAAEFALLLRDSPFKGNATYEALRRRAVKLIGNDERGDRAEFLTLIREAEDAK